MKYFLLFSLIMPYFFLILDMWGNSFDAHFSDKTKEKLRVKDNSFLRKVIPFKEKDYVTKNGYVYGHRYFLKIRAIPLFIYSLLVLVLLPLAIINIFVEFIPLVVAFIFSVILLSYIILHEIIISICSQGLNI